MKKIERDKWYQAKVLGLWKHVRFTITQSNLLYCVIDEEKIRQVYDIAGFHINPNGVATFTKSANEKGHGNLVFEEVQPL
jgi:hypothetical protein